MDFLQGLNPYQAAAVQHQAGPALVIAGAGAGKTKVLVHRIGYLIEQGVDPAQICAITFTAKAAGEMRERLEGMLGASAKRVLVGTFHRLGLWLLKGHGDAIGLSRFEMMSNDQALGMVGDLLAQLGYKGRGDHLLRYISKVRIGGLTDAAVHQLYGEVAELLLELVGLYEHSKREAGLLDFDDLLLKSVELLEASPLAAKEAKERTLYTLVDEYQDTNPTHERLIEAVQQQEANQANLFAVGDPDQAIYGFNNGTIQNILAFTAKRPQSKVYPLLINYRSQAHIIELANQLIRHNQQRKSQSLIPAQGFSVKPMVFECQDPEEEAQMVVELAKTHQGPLENMAVLLRTSAAARVIEKHLVRNNIPYTLLGGVRFYDRAEIKTMLSLLKIASNTSGKEDWFRLLHTIGGVEQQVLSALDAGGFEGKELIQALPNRYAQGLMAWALQQQLESNWAADYSVWLENLGEGLERYLQRLARGDKENFLQRKANLEELGLALAEFQQENPGARFEDFLLFIMVEGRQQDGGGVQVLTMHASKGLEWGKVVVVGMFEKNFPSWGAQSDEELEEERRLCYVALTRAKQDLILSVPQKGVRFGELRSVAPSRFLAELPAEHVQFCRFSSGTVQEIWAA